MVKQILKKIIIIVLAIIGFAIVFYFLFTNFYPSFGGEVSKARKLVYQKSPQFKKGIFNNHRAVPKDLNFSETLKLSYTFLTTKVPNGRPKKDLKVHKLDSAAVANYTKEARLVWYGHSSFLLQLKGKTILLDPMLGKVAAPHPLLGANRFNTDFPLAVEKLGTIDAVIFSHDHYDHLDYETILKIKDKTKQFYVPLGLGVHLEAWGVSKNKITELDWWQETQLEELTLVCTPAQHFSGRKFNTTQSTLWSSWVIQSADENIYFSGDSGYASHFKEIGKKYGPFDIALMECGQYDKMWPDIHMMPEETAQAGIDIKARKIMPIHWAGFKLALHDWTDPVTRLKVAADKLNLPILTPKLGAEIRVKDSINTTSNWWQGL
ncbi:MBL fold metallo-hydrolase [Cellulophaga baltica]|uniref:MBL fold metallo-hydrolase n=1 Tax=Cellulophaga baltica TaxID=76594 RepID=UPI0021479E62|nr:MBL fold metallo-hydrolase [Cellulophaga baltica]MCR1023475.1 MBL fold metallo-hydrolase [Cellulophaga baltica]